MVADHIDHVREVAGIDHVGIGSDFDGVELAARGPRRRVSGTRRSLAELLRRGYSDDDVRKIGRRQPAADAPRCRVVARRLQTEREPSQATIEELDGSG